MRFTEGLATPTAVIHDPRADVYLVANDRRSSVVPEHLPFISRLAPNGRIVALRWIEGGKNGVTLRSPKGLALSASLLYVADVDTVRSFDRITGAPAAQVRIPGAQDLVDVVVIADGRVLASDAGGGKIFAIGRSEEVSTVASQLERPRALLAAPEGIWVTNASGELELIGAGGAPLRTEQLPVPSLDGVVGIGRELIVSSGLGSALLRGAPGVGSWTLLGTIGQPADIGFDAKRGRLLVPFPRSNMVEAYDLR